MRSPTAMWSVAAICAFYHEQWTIPRCDGSFSPSLSFPLSLFLYLPLSLSLSKRAEILHRSRIGLQATFRLLYQVIPDCPTLLTVVKCRHCQPGNLPISQAIALRQKRGGPGSMSQPSSSTRGVRTPAWPRSVETATASAAATIVNLPQRIRPRCVEAAHDVCDEFLRSSSRLRRFGSAP